MIVKNKKKVLLAGYGLGGLVIKEVNFPNNISDGG